MDNKGQLMNTKSVKKTDESHGIDNIVLDKVIFSSVFEKDIRRVYIYKKSERLAKAIHLIAPAFRDVKALKDRIHRLSVDIVDASVLPPAAAKDALSRELLALSSVLGVARSAGILTPMNTDIILREVHYLLQEIAGYEDPRLSLEDMPSLASLAKSASSSEMKAEVLFARPSVKREEPDKRHTYNKGQIEVKKDKNGRRESILSIVRSKGPVDIKDLSTLIREVSEKTIQRELQALVEEGKVKKTGERRWTRYAPVISDKAESVEIDLTAVSG